MANSRRWFGKLLSWFVATVFVLLWLALAIWLVVDWRGFWGMLGDMEITSMVIALMLLFFGPFWLVRKFRKGTPEQQNQVIDQAGVVYLRPFSADAGAVYEFAQMATLSSERTLEQLLCEQLKVFGTIVTIGRPDEMIVRDGAVRVYVGKGGDWQDCVRKLSQAAKAVVLVAGKTPGLLWEKEHTRKAVNPLRLLLVIPASLSRERERIIENVERAFGVSLPEINERLRVPRFVVFDEKWQSTLLPNVYRYWIPHLFGLPLTSLSDYWKCKETLAPFLARAQAAISFNEHGEPGTGNGCKPEPEVVQRSD